MNLDHFSRCSGLSVLHDDVIEENDFGQLHRDVILVGAGLQVGDDRRTNAERRNGQALKWSYFRLWTKTIHGSLVVLIAQGSK